MRGSACGLQVRERTGKLVRLAAPGAARAGLWEVSVATRRAGPEGGEREPRGGRGLGGRQEPRSRRVERGETREERAPLS